MQTAEYVLESERKWKTNSKYNVNKKNPKEMDTLFSSELLTIYESQTKQKEQIIRSYM